MISPASLRLAAVPLLVVLASCGSGDGEGGATPAPGNAGAEDVAQTAPRPAAPFPKAALVVSADGLAVKGGSSLAFGTARDAVDTYAARAFGAAPARSRQEECGAGPMDVSAYGPLQLLFQDGRFGGWYLSGDDGAAAGSAPRVATVDGIAPGVSMALLGAERQVRPITDSTLGAEFQYLSATGGMITGFYDGDLRSGTVTGLAAGLTCFFR